MAMDTLRAAIRHLAAASLDHTGRRLSGRRDRPVRAELHPGRDHRRFRPGLAFDRGGVVYIYSYFQIVQQKNKGISNNDIVTYVLIFATLQLAARLHFRHYHYV